MHKRNVPLESLIIGGCHSGIRIARVQLPPSLKQMKISNSTKLKDLIDEDQVSE